MAVGTAAGVGMAVIAGEHFFSTYLSSPVTTERFFADSEDGKAKTRRMCLLAMSASLVTGLVLSMILREPWPLVATLILGIMYLSVYEKALAREL